MTRSKRSRLAPWAAFFSSDLTLTAVEVEQKYLSRWSIEVFFKEAKQRLGIGQEQGRSFAAQVLCITQAFFRYSLLAYLLEQDNQSQTIGEVFRQAHLPGMTVTIALHFPEKCVKHPGPFW